MRITGPVAGSVMAAGRDVRVTGHVDGSVRAAGQSVTLGGSVGRNAALGGQTVLVGETAQVARDLHAGGSIVEIDGRVAKDVGLAAATGALRGQVGGDLRWEGSALTLGPAGRVGGDLRYRSGSPPALEPGANVSGRMVALPPRPPKQEARPTPMRRMLFPLVAFVFGAVGLAAAPRIFRGAASAVPIRPWWNLLLGLLALVVTPIAAIIAMVTIVGLPLGLLALIAWLVALLFSSVPVGVFVGRSALRAVGRGAVSPYLALLIGIVVLALAGGIPVLGGLVRVLVVLAGVGAYTRALKGLVVEMRAATP